MRRGWSVVTGGTVDTDYSTRTRDHEFLSERLESHPIQATPIGGFPSSHDTHNIPSRLLLCPSLPLHPPFLS